MSTSLIQGLWVLIAGLGLGSLHFVGLWLTVRRVAQLRLSGLGLLASLLLRLALVALGLYLVAGNRWQDYLAALLGILAARMYWTRRLGRPWPGLHDTQPR
jgi:F1F0 ATPase subunit 2